MRAVVIIDRSLRNNTKWVDVSVTRKVVVFDVEKLHSLFDLWVLIELLHEPVDVWVVPNMLLVGLEVNCTVNDIMEWPAYHNTQYQNG